jgi:hypothetical protein
MLDKSSLRCVCANLIIAASTMGLIIKLIVEKDTEEDQRQKIIDHFIKEIILKI